LTVETNSWPEELVKTIYTSCTCTFCLQRLGGRAQIIQPGWIGPDFERGKGIAVILQNPADPKSSYDDDRLRAYESRYSDFLANPCPVTVSSLMTHIMNDVLGIGQLRPWKQWTRIVQYLTNGKANDIAWLNTVPFPTLNDKLPTSADVKHSVKNHLNEILTVLQPRAVVTVGSMADSALFYLNQMPRRHETVPMRGFGSDIANLRSTGARLLG
jgi:hypothetical protein